MIDDAGFRAGGNRFVVMLGYGTLDHKRCGPTNERGGARKRAGQVLAEVPELKGLNLNPHGPRAGRLRPTY